MPYVHKALMTAEAVPRFVRNRIKEGILDFRLIYDFKEGAWWVHYWRRMK